MTNLRDQLIMEQPLKFCLNGGEKDKQVFENAFNEKTGILSFSSRLYLKEVDKIKKDLERKYANYQFCYVQEIGCAEIGFSRREIN